MRLLRLGHDGGFGLAEFTDEDAPPYAILSHTWGPDKEEVTFKDLIEGTGKDKIGYQKLEFCAKQASADGIQYIWVDTCAIDKTSSAELSEAINSMFNWYRHSSKCYVFLSDVSANSSDESQQHLSTQTCDPAFRNSRWFTRGWTLQELLAPTSVEFFSKEGTLLGSRRSLWREIHEITGINERALHGSLMFDFGVTERLSWAANRKTKRAEDAAYSLLGIFDVNMPLLYGEGQKRALARLYREIKDSLTNDPPAILSSGLDDPIKAEPMDTKDKVELNQNESDTSAQSFYTPCSPLDNSPISAVRSSPKEIDVVVLADDNTLRYLRLAPDSSSTPPKWQSDGKWFSDTGVVLSRKRSRVEIIAPTPYGKILYQEVQAGVLMKQHWESVGHPITGPLSAVSWGSGRIDVFGLSGGGVLHKALAFNSWLPSKDDWENIGYGTAPGHPQSGIKFKLPPVVVSMVPGRLDLICAREHSGLVFHKWWDGQAWGPSKDHWREIGGKLLTPPAAVATGPNRFDVLALGTDRNMYHRAFENNAWWGNWHLVLHPGITFLSRPSVVSARSGSLDIFCVGTDHAMYHRTYYVDKGGWEPPNEWTSLGGDFDSAPMAVAGLPGKIYVFCRGVDEEIYYMAVGDDEWKSLGMVD